MRPIATLVAAASLALPAAAAAQGPASASPSDERRLSPEQVEKILADAAAKWEQAARPSIENVDVDDRPTAPQMHGEFGFAIGTGGYREAYGTAIYPLGDDGFAAISLDLADWGTRRFRK
ncbi:MAG TPA: hypothetical protein VNJ05_03835 [Sphingomicrobium sp.]|nr:hypothetical protein [Sphingomicrobium sp.]